MTTPETTTDAGAERDGQTGEEREYYSLTRRVYRTFAPFYDVAAFPLASLRAKAADVVHVDSESRVLDVATGTGAQARAFAAKGASVIGVDLSESMLRVARRKSRAPSLVFQQADATTLPFDDASFDASSISFALHEMPASIRERTLREMARVTKPGGAIVVVDFGPKDGSLAASLAYRLIKLYEPDDYVDFVRSDLRALLEGCGLEVRDDRRALGGVARIVVAHVTDAGAQIDEARGRTRWGSGTST